MTHALTDSATMLRRNLRHAIRYPSMTFATLASPVIMLLLFNYAFGGALEAGIGGGAYIDYIAPGIILVGATAGSVATARRVRRHDRGDREPVPDDGGHAHRGPHTPIIETLRGLLMGTEIGSAWIWALGWCAVIGAGGYGWARAAFARKPA